MASVPAKKADGGGVVHGIAEYEDDVAREVDVDGPDVLTAVLWATG